MTTVADTRTSWHLGLPHTHCGAVSEVALLMHALDIQWTIVGRCLGCPASRLLDRLGQPVYASVYFVDLSGFPDTGLAAFGPDDDLDIVSTLHRFGKTMLDGGHSLYPAGLVPPESPGPSPAPHVRLSNVLVSLGAGQHDLRIATPANADVECIPALTHEPDSYRLIKEAQQRGAFFDPPSGAPQLADGTKTVDCRINRDRDLNGVGLLYFANYVAFMDFAERTVLERDGLFPPDALDGRVTLRRRIGFYGNAAPHDTLTIAVQAFGLDATREHLMFHYRVQRRSDGRTIAVASAEKRLRRL